jgi:hypothetical protein
MPAPVHLVSMFAVLEKHKGEPALYTLEYWILARMGNIPSLLIIEMESFVSSFSTGPPGDRGDLHCRWNVITTNRNRFVSSAGLLPVAQEQSRTRGNQAAALRINLNVEGCGIVAAPVHAPSRAPPPSFTQSPSPPRSLVRDGQTSPHRPRLVVSRSTCPPLSPSPHANSFIIGTAVINKHIEMEQR